MYKSHTVLDMEMYGSSDMHVLIINLKVDIR